MGSFSAASASSYLTKCNSVPFFRLVLQCLGSVHTATCLLPCLNTGKQEYFITS
jgi:hypothetical protein